MFQNKIRVSLTFIDKGYCAFVDKVVLMVAPNFLAISIMVLQFILSLGYLYIIPPSPIKFNYILYFIAFAILSIALADNLIRYIRYRKKSLIKLFSPISILGLFFILFYQKYLIGSISTDDYHFGERIVFFLQAKNFDLKYFIDLSIVHSLTDILPSLLGDIIFYDTTLNGFYLGSALFYNIMMMAILLIGSYVYLSVIFLIPLFYVGQIQYTLIAVSALAIIKFATGKLSNFKIILTLSIFILFSFSSYFLAQTVAVPAIVALSPVAIYYLFIFLKNNLNNRINYLFLIIPLTLFLSIFIYINNYIISSLKELLINASVNLVAYGNTANMYDIVIRDQHYFLMPIFIIYLLSSLLADKKNLKIIFTLLLIIFITIFITSYSLGRLDGKGTRSIIIFYSTSMPIMLYLLNLMFKKHKLITSVILLAVIPYFIFIQRDTIIALPSKFHSETNYSLSNATNKEFPEVGMATMNDIHKNYMLNLKEILSKNNIGVDEYLDLTNRGATYYYLQRKMPIPYLSYYNMGSEEQSVRAINSLKADIIYPKFVLLSPAIAHDGLKLPIRGNLLYRYLLLSGKYSVVTDGDFVYLLYNVNGHTFTLEELQILNETLSMDIMYAPDVFGSNINKLKNDLSLLQNIKFSINKVATNKIEIQFETPVDMRQLDFIYFADTSIKQNKKYAIYLNVNPEYGIMFLLSSKDKKLVQLDIMPSIMLAKDIKNLTIESDAHIDIKDVRFYKRTLNFENNL